ncbi:MULTISPECIES: phosphotransferase family protein [Brevibacterium]|uniref:Aminoglycoside phosphotransferase domain-containing protein n=1 Tax=Brevibacterium picturae TaxID=260553 RepID=A0ABP4MCK1_9MICO|nr:phosphotransferase [Brevibacterium atlanticum]
MTERATNDAQEVLRRLIAAAGLPPPVSVRPVDDGGNGLDNRLTTAELADGRLVVLRQSRMASGSPRRRIEFLRANGITTPQQHASDDEGAALWEYIPGRTLAEAVAAGTADATVWRRTGAALAEVHSVRFPRSLEGAIETDSLPLRAVDPVERLHEGLATSGAWVEQHRPHLRAALGQVSRFITDRANEIRAERPSVLHGDINLLNIIVTDDSAQLIDWDFPRVGQPLAELSALDEHAYLHGLDGLPSAFFEGYGQPVPGDLLLAYRIVGCLGWLASDDWTEWDADSGLPDAARSRLNRWHQRLLDWCDRIPDLMTALR